MNMAIARQFALTNALCTKKATENYEHYNSNMESLRELVFSMHIQFLTYKYEDIGESSTATNNILNSTTARCTWLDIDKSMNEWAKFNTPLDTQ